MLRGTHNPVGTVEHALLGRISCTVLVMVSVALPNAKYVKRLHLILSLKWEVVAHVRVCK